MSPLEAHMDAVISVVCGRTGPESLNTLMRDGADIGPRALVYRNSSLLAASDALKSNFQATAAIMGPDFFGAMARAYVDQQRPSDRSLVGYGDDLPDFIAAGEAEHGLPWLADLARLDMAWLMAHLASDDPILDPSVLATLAQTEADLLAATLLFGAHVQIVSCDWQVFALWADLRRGDDVDSERQMTPGEQTVLISRGASEVVFRQLSEGEIEFLTSLQCGQRLEEAVIAGLRAAPDFDISQTLAISLADGLFTALKGTK